MSIRTPFTAQVSSCESALSFESTITSQSDSEAMLLNHDYADPVDLQSSIKVEMDKIDRKKKQNLIYEPTTTIKKNNGNKEKPHKCKLVNWGLVFLFLISSCALTLSLLIILGIVSTKGNCIKEEIPMTSKLTSNNGDIVNIDSMRIMEELQKNVTSLNNQIPSLLRQLADLQLNLANMTKGPQGEVGPQGEPGAGDLSKCIYKTEGAAVSYHQDEPNIKTKTTTMWVKNEKGFIILGATCTTTGGTEHGLFQKTTKEERFFQCKCAGRSKTLAFKADSLECRMHYWECPTKS